MQPYKLYYWPGLPGRGEFVRLSLKEAAIPFLEMHSAPRRVGGGMAAIEALLNGKGTKHPPFAPPFLKAGKLLIGQTANILAFLGEQHGLAPKNNTGRFWTAQLQLTLADWVTEAHDAHHPLGVGQYYEKQRAAAKKRAHEFCCERIPKFLDYFERVLKLAPKGGFFLGRQRTYADLSLFQMIAGLNYAFPNVMRRALKKTPHVKAVHDLVTELPRIAHYLASPEKLSFNEQGIFRHYPELDK